MISRFFILNVISCVLLAGCGQKQEEIKIPEGMHAVSLLRFGKPITLFVPDTLTAQFAVQEETDGALVVSSGRSFAIAVYEQHVDLALKKRDIVSDEVNRMKRMISESDSGLIWESAIIDAEHHFVINRMIGDRSYSFSEVPGHAFGETAIRAMYNSAATAYAD
jgi:hypothetical protein